MDQVSGLPGIQDFYVSFTKAQWRLLGNSLASALQPSSRDERVRLKPWRSEWPSNCSMRILMQACAETRL
jgi:hypothetical protein